MTSKNKILPTRLTTEEFITKAKLVHGNKYSYCTTKYVLAKKSVEITCPIHGRFTQRANDHLMGCGCKQCKHDKIGNIKRKSIKTFITQAREVHKTIKYDYSKFVYINARTKGTIICPLHGEFEKTPDKHTNCAQGCPVCSYNMSNGERIIANYLFEHNIKYKHNKTFDDLLGTTKNSRLRYDFYLPKFKLLIEYDGQQHFEVSQIRNIPAKYAEGIHHRTVKYDKIKNKYAKKNGYKLLRIPYTEFKNIEDILKISITK